MQTGAGKVAFITGGSRPGPVATRSGLAQEGEGSSPSTVRQVATVR